MEYRPPFDAFRSVRLFSPIFFVELDVRVDEGYTHFIPLPHGIGRNASVRWTTLNRRQIVNSFPMWAWYIMITEVGPRPTVAAQKQYAARDPWRFSAEGVVYVFPTTFVLSVRDDVQPFAALPRLPPYVVPERLSNAASGISRTSRTLERYRDGTSTRPRSCDSLRRSSGNPSDRGIAARFSRFGGSVFSGSVFRGSCVAI